MFAAARIPDPITHDMLVPSGVIGPPLVPPPKFGTVIIEGLPAATVSCSAICSGAISAGIVHPPLPIPPAPPPVIVKGDFTVLICGLPAARWTPALDVTACGAFLGDPKLLAMRKTFIGKTP
jgi:uncharacterized Zn-binding protein involved in type VI secretion